MSKALSLLFLLAYPAPIYWGISRGAGGHTVWFLGVLSALLCTRGAVALVFQRSGGRSAATRHLLSGGALGALALWSAAGKTMAPLTLFPVLVNGALLFVFAGSLVVGPPIVERFARLQKAQLSLAQRLHCRQVTVVWCGFFILNGAAAAALARWGSTALWALYTGFIAYLLMGILAFAELVVRRYRFEEFGDGLLDRCLRSVMAKGAPR